MAGEKRQTKWAQNQLRASFGPRQCLEQQLEQEMSGEDGVYIPDKERLQCSNGEGGNSEANEKDCETHYRGKGLILFAGLNRLFKVHFAPTSS